MDSAPAPGVIACGNCKFARSVRMSPNDFRKQLTCRLFPPQNVVGITAQGPVVFGSGFALVTDVQWCFQFQPAQSREEIDAEEAPKLLGNDYRTILKN